MADLGHRSGDGELDQFLGILEGNGILKLRTREANRLSLDRQGGQGVLDGHADRAFGVAAEIALGYLGRFPGGEFGWDEKLALYLGSHGQRTCSTKFFFEKASN